MKSEKNNYCFWKYRMNRLPLANVQSIKKGEEEFKCVSCPGYTPKCKEYMDLAKTPKYYFIGNQRP